MVKSLKLFISLLLVASLFIFVGCGGSDSEDVVQGGDNENLGDDNSVEVLNKMEYCYTYDETQPVKYEYYFTNEEYYEKVETDNNGWNEKIVTVENICINNPQVENSMDSWNCIGGTSADLMEHLEAVRELTQGSMAKAMKIQCEKINYDSSKFSKN